MTVPRTMYEVHWHSVNGLFTNVSVTPITVTREGILPGCSGVSITAKDSDGLVFQGSLGNYFETESLAWALIKQQINESILSNNRAIKDLYEQVTRLQSFLSNLERSDVN